MCPCKTKLVLSAQDQACRVQNDPYEGGRGCRKARLLTHLLMYWDDARLVTMLGFNKLIDDRVYFGNDDGILYGHEHIFERTLKQQLSEFIDKHRDDLLQGESWAKKENRLKEYIFNRRHLELVYEEAQNLKTGKKVTTVFSTALRRSHRLFMQQIIAYEAEGMMDDHDPDRYIGPGASAKMLHV